MRRAAKVDVGQAAIVEALRGIGCTVQSLAAVGSGCPDLVVGFRGRNLLLEVKAPPGPRGGKSKDGQALGVAQVRWALAWRGQSAVVTCAAHAIVVVTGGVG